MRVKKFKDKIIISKGHATVTLYPLLKDFGVLSEDDWNNWGKKNDESILKYLETLLFLE